MLKKVLVTALATVMLLGTTAAMAAGSLSLSGSSSMYPLTTKLGPQYNATHSSDQITFSYGSATSNSGEGITAVEAGTVNIGTSSRDKKTGDPADLVFTKICRDAVAIIVNSGNAVPNLTQEQVNGIYAGTYTNWSQVGGPNQPIKVYTRELGSGTLDFFKTFFMGSTPIISTATVANGSSEIRTAVAGNTYAIGFVGISYLTGVKALPIKFTGTQTYYAPTIVNAQSGLYKAVRYFNMVTKGTPTGNAQLFINWILSSQGQTYVQQDGEVPLH